MSRPRCVRCRVEELGEVAPIQLPICPLCAVVMLDEIEEAAARVQKRIEEHQIDWQDAYESLYDVCTGEADIWNFPNPGLPS
jgi:hypothetical protein